MLNREEIEREEQENDAYWQAKQQYCEHDYEAITDEPIYDDNHISIEVSCVHCGKRAYAVHTLTEYIEKG